MKRDLKLERVFPHAPERVWRALTDRRAMSQWLMETDFEPTLGHCFTFRAKPQPGWDGVTYCEVTELDPPHRVAYTWRGGSGKDGPPTLDTVVRFTLAAEGSGTRLTLEHTGFTGLKAMFVSFMMKAGWTKMLR
ncbi:MAG: SRPBCC domain-containing protein, partial [Kofleriaceae bacterium]